MIRTLMVLGIVAALLQLAVSASAQWPLSEEQGYAAYRKDPCPKCAAGIKPAQSVTMWVVTPTMLQRYPTRSWLRIRVNGRDTDLGEYAAILDGQLMLPVMTAPDFGLTPSRSNLNHRLMTLAGGRQPVKIMVGSRLADVGPETHCMHVCPKWHNGKVYIPIENIGGLLGWTFQFDKPGGVLSITVPQGAAATPTATPAPAQPPVGLPRMP